MNHPLRLLKWLGFGILLVLAVVVLAALLVVQSEPGTRWAVSQAVKRANAGPALSLSYESLSGTLVAGLSLEGVEAVIAAEGGSHRLDLERLEFQWNPFRLRDRLVSIDSLALRGLDLRLAASQNEEPADVAAILEQVFSLPVDFEIRRVSVQDFSLAMENLALDAAEISGDGLSLDNARLRADGLGWQGAEYGATAADVVLEAGSWALAGELAWQAGLPDLDLEGAATLDGSLSELNISHRLLRPLALNSTGTVMTGLPGSPEPMFDLRHEVQGLRAAMPGLEILQGLSGNLRTQGSPAAVNLSGALLVSLRDIDDPFAVELDAGYADGAIAIESLSLRNGLVDFSASGRLGLSPALSLQAGWRLDALDPGPWLPRISLEEVRGNGDISLTLEDAGLSAQLSLAALSGRLNGYPLDASGRLGLNQGQLGDFFLDLQAQENSLQLEGGLQPELDIAWRVDAPALAVLHPGLGGRIRGSGRVAGSPASPQVSGSLSGGALSYAGPEGDYVLDSISLSANYREQSGNNRLDLALDNLSFPLGGSVYLLNMAELQLSGELEQHSLGLEASLQSQRLLVSADGGYSAGNWQGRLNQAALVSDYGNWELAGETALAAGAEQASIGAHCWEFLQTSLCGQGQWSAAGGYEAAIELSDLPLALLNSAETVSRLEDASLTRRLADKPIGLTSLQERFSLSPPANTFVDGLLDLEATVNSGTGEWPLIQAGIRPRDLRVGLLVEQEDESQTLQPLQEVFEFDQMALNLERREGLWLSSAGFAVWQRQATGRVPLGRLDGRLNLDDGDNLEGGMTLDFADIAWLETLLPQISNSAGELSVEADIGGNLERPLLLAELALDQGAFDLAEYGLQIRELALNLQSEGDNLINLRGSALSGEGRLALEGRISSPLLDSRKLELAIRGEDFQVMNLADTRAVVSPDLALTLDRESLDVRGEVAVPRFLLDIEESEVVARSGGVEVSRDVVVVEAPPEQSELLQPTAAEAVRRIAVTGDVDLQPGDEVRFSGYGLDLLLGGGLTIEMEATRPVLVYGEVNVVEGTYESYGQELSAEGKLIFLGNPTNPALDIRAFREIENATVGVQMSGTLRNIQGQLYSTPVLPENEILAILVTGKSFQNVGPQDSDSLLTAIANFGIERGQGITETVRGKLGLDTLEVSGGSTLDDSSLGLGKYITPDLFLRYDIGLFDRQSNLSLFYTLTERMRLEVQTGVSQSVDLTYTVEK